MTEPNRTRHGNPMYNSWVSMKQRCSNPNNRAWLYYGGRGIKVCDSWVNSFDNFIDDVGDRPFEGAQLDRTDTNGDYEPSNVRWITASENMKNRRPSSEWRKKGSLEKGEKYRGVALSMPADLYVWVKSLADSDRRSLSWMINNILQNKMQSSLPG